MRALLVVNPRATTTTAAGRDLIGHALASELKLDVALTRRRGHAAELAAQARGDGVELIVVLGGDGTVNEVVNGLLAAGPGPEVPAMGVVPGGSANVLARALGVPREPLEATEALLGALLDRRVRSVGLGRANGRWFTFNAGMGWDADVIEAVERAREAGREATPARYAWTAFTHYLRQRRRTARLTAYLPGEAPAPGLRLAFVSNTDPWTYLGARPFRTNPGSSLDAGLGLFALRRLGAPTVLRVLGQALGPHPDPRCGALLRRDDVRTLRVTSSEPVNLQVDGDHLGRHDDVEFVSVPAALRVVV